MSKKKLIYISAPISGCEDTAQERFSDAVQLAREHGFIAVNPYAENKNYNKRSDAIIAELHTCRQCAFCDWRNQYCEAKDADLGKAYMVAQKQCSYFEGRKEEEK